MVTCCAGCATAPQAQFQDVSPQQQQLQELLWHGERAAALELLKANSWVHRGNVALERERQDLRLRLGQREAVLLELQSWLQQNPQSADLNYLQARLLEDPIGRFQALRELHKKHPQHSWSSIGLIATAQLLERWGLAERWLASTHPSPQNEAFLRIVQARQLAHQGKPNLGLELLAADAFQHHFERSLREYWSLAASSDNHNEARRASSELALRRVEQSQPDISTRIDLAFQRLLGEWHLCQDLSLDETLLLLDGWCELAGAPSGWAQVDSYALAGVARLIHPETIFGGVSLEWADAERYLLAGSALGRSTELHLLRDVVVMRLDWPQHEMPIEMVAARSVMSPQSRTAQGGTVFRGFYLRLDSLERGAEQLQRELQQILQRNPEFATLNGASSTTPAGPLESQQLPTRLRLQALATTHSSVRDLELVHLAMHEAGHLGEVLNWLDLGLPVFGVGASFLNSQLELGNPLLWLEYRAQLRAVASGWQPGWALAEVIDRGQNPRDPYYAPYRLILSDLVQLAEFYNWPPLADWDQLDRGSIVALARELIRLKGFEPSPDLGTDRVVQSLLDFNLLEQAPGDRVLPVQLH